MSDAGIIGIIGGSGLYDMPELEVLEEVCQHTPFGEPSDRFVIGELAGTKAVFLSRHGPGHRHSAHDVNYRANIFGMKALGVGVLISVNAVGSLREGIHPTNMVIPDQFFDYTKNRVSTFFDGGPAVHVGFADPVCPELSELLFNCCEEAGARTQLGGLYLAIEGPSFSTRAESNLYRTWGADIIGMTAVTEAKLAREAEICYASLSLVTDYDVWKDKAEDVTTELILKSMRKGVKTAREVVRLAVPRYSPGGRCKCRSALGSAIAGDPSTVSEEKRAELEPLLGRYLPPEKRVG